MGRGTQRPFEVSYLQLEEMEIWRGPHHPPLLQPRHLRLPPHLRLHHGKRACHRIGTPPGRFPPAPVPLVEVVVLEAFLQGTLQGGKIGEGQEVVDRLICMHQKATLPPFLDRPSLLVQAQEGVGMAWAAISLRQGSSQGIVGVEVSQGQADQVT